MDNDDVKKLEQGKGQEFENELKQKKQKWNDIDQFLQELVDGQQKTLLQFARRIVPNATSDDILQPNDFPELENHPHFRYEEGVLAGLQSAQMALRCQQGSRIEISGDSS